DLFGDDLAVGVGGAQRVEEGGAGTGDRVGRAGARGCTRVGAVTVDLQRGHLGLVADRLLGAAPALVPLVGGAPVARVEHDVRDGGVGVAFRVLCDGRLGEGLQLGRARVEALLPGRQRREGRV